MPGKVHIVWSLAHANLRGRFKDTRISFSPKFQRQNQSKIVDIGQAAKLVIHVVFINNLTFYACPFRWNNKNKIKEVKYKMFMLCLYN